MMTAGMNTEEAKVIANKMRFEDAVYNALSAKCVPYRKATKLKLKELLDIAKDVDEAKSKWCDEVELSIYYNGWNDGYKKREINMQKFVKEKCKELGIDYTLILVTEFTGVDNMRKITKILLNVLKFIFAVLLFIAFLTFIIAWSALE